MPKSLCGVINENDKWGSEKDICAEFSYLFFFFSNSSRVLGVEKYSSD